jgi:transcriptional/translational regulatory protein YebC/TACO1
VPVATAELSFHPQTTIQVTGKAAEQMLGLMDALEEHDDVKNVFANFDISESEMEAIEASKK